MSVLRTFLSQDFVRMGAINQLDPIWNFTRASSATRINSSGLVETVATNVPRFDYDPVTLKCKGLLLEPQRTNLLTSSVLSSGWSNDGLNTATHNSVVAPDGTTTGTKVSGGGYFYKTGFQSAGTYRMSAWVKMASGTGSITFESGSTVAVTNVWQRYSSDVVYSAPTVASFLFPGSSEIHVWGVQLESGPYVTSYIPTAGSAVTRSADNCYTEELSPWFNPTSGTFGFEWERRTKDADQAFVGLTGNDYFAYGSASSDIVRVQIPGIAGNAVGSVAGLGVNKFALSYAPSVSSKGSVNGIAPVTLPAMSGFSVTKWTLGTNLAGGESINGHVRRLQFLPYAVDDFTLKAMAT